MIWPLAARRLNLTPVAVSLTANFPMISFSFRYKTEVFVWFYIITFHFVFQQKNKMSTEKSSVLKKIIQLFSRLPRDIF